MVLLCRSFATFIRCTADMIQPRRGIGIGTGRTRSLGVSCEKSVLSWLVFIARSRFRVVEATSNYDVMLTWGLAISRRSERPRSHVTGTSCETVSLHCPLAIGWIYIWCDLIWLFDGQVQTKKIWNVPFYGRKNIPSANGGKLSFTSEKHQKIGTAYSLFNQNSNTASRKVKNNSCEELARRLFIVTFSNLLK